ncbi:MAG TPA: integrase core domain-containing protein [Candidatus Dormibacteraeota bacterium]|nr:integrase core domain-containing protein [Candidatus Dormibacteraeota bacterium]
MLKAVIEKNGWSLIGAWKKKYNEERPHRSLGNLTREFAPRIAALRPPTADSAPQFGERNEIEVMSSGDLKVV